MGGRAGPVLLLPAQTTSSLVVQLRPRRLRPERPGPSACGRMVYFRNDPSSRTSSSPAATVMCSVSSLQRIFWGGPRHGAGQSGRTTRRAAGSATRRCTGAAGDELPVYLPQRVRRTGGAAPVFRLAAGNRDHPVRGPDHISSAMEVTPYTHEAVPASSTPAGRSPTRRSSRARPPAVAHREAPQGADRHRGCCRIHLHHEGYPRIARCSPQRRSVQEQVEVKSIGGWTAGYHSSLRASSRTAHITSRIDAIRDADEVRFSPPIATC
jgi:hypothetical protein